MPAATAENQASAIQAALNDVAVRSYSALKARVPRRSRMTSPCGSAASEPDDASDAVADHLLSGESEQAFGPAFREVTVPAKVLLAIASPDEVTMAAKSARALPP